MSNNMLFGRYGKLVIPTEKCINFVKLGHPFLGVFVKLQFATEEFDTHKNLSLDIT